MSAPAVHEQVRCPRCAARGMRELSRLPEEGHGVFMCPFCKHTWCEQGRIRDAGAAPRAAARPAGSRSAQDGAFALRQQERIS